MSLIPKSTYCRRSHSAVEIGLLVEGVVWVMDKRKCWLGYILRASLS